MSTRSGIIYETDKGEFGLAIHEEQEEAFTRFDKVYLHVFLDSLCTKPKIDPVTKKKYVTLKHISKLTIVGYSD